MISLLSGILRNGNGKAKFKEKNEETNGESEKEM